MGYFITESTIFAFLFLRITLGVVGLDPSLVSPCPSLFVYRLQNEARYTWYGTLLITGYSDSYVVESVRIILDREAESLQLYGHKNSQVTVETLDNTEYLIEGLEEKIRKHNTYSMTIELRYRPGGPIPRLIAYRVNEVTTCSETTTIGSDGEIHVQKPGVTTFRPATTHPTAANVHSPWTSRPTWLNPQQTPVPTPMGEVCGTRVQAVTPLIVGGEESRRGEWPWHGALFALERQNTQYRCGASLVSRRHAVTAAHCVCLHQRSEEPLDPDQLFLVFGRMQLFNWGDPDSQSIRAKRIIVHPEYNSTFLRNDIAVVRLVEPVRITPYVRPVCLWSASDTPDINLLAQRKGTVVGWGYTERGEVSETLQHAHIPVILPHDCVSSKSDFYLQFLSPTSFCAGSVATDHSKTMQACNGDSGGGMVFPRPGTDVWRLRGVVSLAPYDRDSNMCDVKLYVVFTDTAYYLDWIQQCLAV